jgi:AraC family transcriptional regulator
MNVDLHGSRVHARQIGAFALTLTRYDRAASLPLHAHDQAYVTVVLSGGYREVANGVTRDCIAQSIVVHAPGERHSNVFGDRSAMCLNVHGGTFERSTVLSPAAAATIAGKLREEFRRPDHVSAMVVEALMLELFAATARQREYERAPSWLRDVRVKLERDFRDTVTLTALAESVSIHPTHLSRAFRQHYGVTVGEFLRDLRVGYARRRLASRAPLQEIALDAGFADQSHFTRTFRRVTGVTPAHFRRGLRG